MVRRAILRSLFLREFRLQAAGLPPGDRDRRREPEIRLLT